MDKFIAQTVINAAKKQPGFVRRKDTIVTVVTGIVWLLAAVVPYLAEISPLIGTAVAAVVTIGGAFVNAFTPGAITPSMAQRLERQAEEDAHEPKHKAPGNWIDDARHALAKG